MIQGPFSAAQRQCDPHQRPPELAPPSLTVAGLVRVRIHVRGGDGPGADVAALPDRGADGQRHVQRRFVFAEAHAQAMDADVFRHPEELPSRWIQRARFTAGAGDLRGDRPRREAQRERHTGRRRGRDAKRGGGRKPIEDGCDEEREGGQERQVAAPQVEGDHDRPAAVGDAFGDQGPRPPVDFGHDDREPLGAQLQGRGIQNGRLLDAGNGQRMLRRRHDGPRRFEPPGNRDPGRAIRGVDQEERRRAGGRDHAVNHDHVGAAEWGVVVGCPCAEGSHARQQGERRFQESIARRNQADARAFAPRRDGEGHVVHRQKIIADQAGGQDASLIRAERRGIARAARSAEIGIERRFDRDHKGRSAAGRQIEIARIDQLPGRFEHHAPPSAGAAVIGHADEGLLAPIRLPIEAERDDALVVVADAERQPFQWRGWRKHAIRVQRPVGCQDDARAGHALRQRAGKPKGVGQSAAHRPRLDRVEGAADFGRIGAPGEHHVGGVGEGDDGHAGARGERLFGARLDRALRGTEPIRFDIGRSHARGVVEQDDQRVADHGVAHHVRAGEGRHKQRDGGQLQRKQPRRRRPAPRAACGRIELEPAPEPRARHPMLRPLDAQHVQGEHDAGEREERKAARPDQAHGRRWTIIGSRPSWESDDRRVALIVGIGRSSGRAHCRLARSSSAAHRRFRTTFGSRSSSASDDH